MDLAESVHAINCYALSKIWYRCGSINLREGNVSLIFSSIKAWLYQDLCVKPLEIALFRPTDRGGLSLMHIKTRAQALLIRSFLETAINPMFRHNLLHEEMYRYYVLQEESRVVTGYTQYYNESFFAMIRTIKYEGSADISSAVCEGDLSIHS